jgi:hypothetical protein
MVKEGILPSSEMEIQYANYTLRRLIVGSWIAATMS